MYKNGHRQFHAAAQLMTRALGATQKRHRYVVLQLGFRRNLRIISGRAYEQTSIMSLGKAIELTAKVVAPNVL